MVLRILRGVVLGLSLTLALPALAELKVAVVDVRIALLGSKAAQQFKEDLEKDIQGDREQVERLTQEAGELGNKLRSGDADLMSEAEHKKMRERWDALRQELGFLRNKIGTVVSKREQEFLKESTPKLEAAINELTEKGGYDLVFRREALLYHSESVDITEALLKKLDSQG